MSRRTKIIGPPSESTYYTSNWKTYTFGEARYWNYPDYAIRDEIRNNIDNDLSIPRSDRQTIKVSVTGSIVTLSGKVRNRMSKLAAYNDAYYFPPVIDVDNNIQIEHSERL